VSANSKQYILHKLKLICIWFVVITVVIALYADETNPMPVSLITRFVISASIVAVTSIPFVRKIGRIYLNTTPDDADLDD